MSIQIKSPWISMVCHYILGFEFSRARSRRHKCVSWHIYCWTALQPGTPVITSISSSHIVTSTNQCSILLFHSLQVSIFNQVIVKLCLLMFFFSIFNLTLQISHMDSFFVDISVDFILLILSMWLDGPYKLILLFSCKLKILFCNGILFSFTLLK